jgi:uncharacterized protein YeeX (DUF496 family)
MRVIERVFKDKRRRLLPHVNISHFFSNKKILQTAKKILNLKKKQGEVMYDEFVDALEDYKFRAAISSKKKKNAIKTLEQFSTSSNSSKPAEAVRDSVESFDSDILRYRLI